MANYDAPGLTYDSGVTYDSAGPAPQYRPHMRMKNRKLNKVSRIIAAWETLAPTESFGGYTLEQFKAKAQQAMDRDAQLSDLNNELTDVHNLRESAIDVVHGAALLVVNGVKATQKFGEDSSLYQTMGYVRKSDRKSGLVRPVKPKAVAAKAA